MCEKYTYVTLFKTLYINYLVNIVHSQLEVRVKMVWCLLPSSELISATFLGRDPHFRELTGGPDSLQRKMVQYVARQRKTTAFGHETTTWYIRMLCTCMFIIIVQFAKKNRIFFFVKSAKILFFTNRHFRSSYQKGTRCQNCRLVNRYDIDRKKMVFQCTYQSGPGLNCQYCNAGNRNCL